VRATMAQVIPLVTENLHRRIVDDSQPLDGDPFATKEAGEEWLRRIQVETDLIREAVDGSTFEVEDFIGELVAFAATAVEMWALHCGENPQDLVKAVAQKYAEGED